MRRAEAETIADADALAGPDERLPHAFVAPLDRMEQQHLRLASAAPLRTKTSAQHARVVDDEQITRSDELDEVAELAVRDLVAHHEQTRFIAARRRALRDQRRW